MKKRFIWIRNNNMDTDGDKNLFQLKHNNPIARYIVWRKVKKLWKKYPKLNYVSIYANLANKHLMKPGR